MKKNGKSSKREPSFLRMMGDNGWMWQMYKGWADEDYYKYKCSFLGTYTVEVFAVVSGSWRHINFNGHMGVLWLEVAGYPDCHRDENNGYSYGNLYDMIQGLEIAEENLVRCGIPFEPDYHFHGRNSANLKRRNDAIRKKLNMEYWEEKAWDTWERNKK